jgi:hypothetical protein
VYSEKLSELFGDNFQDKHDCLFQRALLTFGNYLVGISWHKTFCKFENNLRAKTDNWRKLFNDTGKNIYLKRLLDSISIDNLKESLQKLIDQYPNNTNWECLFIKNTGIIEYCVNYQIDIWSNKVNLARSAAPYWRKHAELYSYTFYKLKLKNKGLILTPFENPYYWDTSDQEPCAGVGIWRFNDYEFKLDVSYSENQFLLTFFDQKDQELPEKIIDKIENCGFLRQNNTDIWECKLGKDADFDNVENKIKEVIALKII